MDIALVPPEDEGTPIVVTGSAITEAPSIPTITPYDTLSTAPQIPNAKQQYVQPISTPTVPAITHTDTPPLAGSTTQMDAEVVMVGPPEGASNTSPSMREGKQPPTGDGNMPTVAADNGLVDPLSNKCE
ncbi:hypothetical protein M422DRAFT_271183 [Sphaerobolus stellatus SS14]|uniref:Uncharacterized protein n=1 Tax=Sphaerobolus stellatus (strain SS14) TaxID=990650 RepID=A0A0C9TED0_SPHS4|nr:hypothetical protein M422DRAFT_271183 [Sphaerobolus stellatus SS14]